MNAIDRPAPPWQVDRWFNTSRPLSLDTLRGFALLGILVMNIMSFSMIFSAYFNPTNYGDLTGANYWVWFLSHTLFDQKFMTLFSMMFGAGVVLFTERAEAKGESPRRLHYRRMLWLILFGLTHGFLLWYGDILYVYFDVPAPKPVAKPKPGAKPAPAPKAVCGKARVTVERITFATP